MSIYSNVPLIVCCEGRKYSGGRLRRKCIYVNKRHIDAPLEIGRKIIHEMGMIDIEKNKVNDDFIISNFVKSGYALTTRKKSSDRYSVIDMILYSVSPKDDLSSGRKDAILVHKDDVNKVKVISGGLVSEKYRRCYDNIILKARCSKKPTFIAIQFDRDRDRLRRGDYIYVVSQEGVKQIRLGVDDESPLEQYQLSYNTNDWQYI